MGLFNKIKTVFRGDIPIYHLPHEALRRQKAAARSRAERRALDALNEQPARLLPEFAKLSSDELLRHFRERKMPSFWPDEIISGDAAAEVLDAAERIVKDRSWELMGFGVLRCDRENVWRRDPLGEKDWGLDYHADVVVAPGDADIRVLWELNRFGHAATLAQAYWSTQHDRYAEAFFAQVEEWIDQNPYARGANWVCAMEVALRAANLLVAFDAFRCSPLLTEERLAMMLRLFDQHGRFIVDNNEFSYIATSNHYLSDVVGLFWIGVMLPELEASAKWRDFGLGEMLREVDKQVLPDGVDFEASTGYHKFVTEMFDASLELARRNGIDVGKAAVAKLSAMHEYLSAVTRPDGGMSLIGDCDGSSFLPATRARTPPDESRSFPDAGIYVLRKDDLYLLFNASDSGVNGRGSHGHNDALSIEVSAYGRAFIVDPGSYAYNLDLDARHLFRSTAYHSTVTVDDEEQNTIECELPFIIGNEAAPRTLEWSVGEKLDCVSAEHYGYRRLRSPVKHRRSVEFDKVGYRWRVTDELISKGEHTYKFRFHFDAGLEVKIVSDAVEACDNICGVSLLISPSGASDAPVLEDSFVSRNYGHREPSLTACWTVRGSDLEIAWDIIPSPPST